MNQTTLIAIALLVAIGAISWYRSGKKTPMDLLTQQDKLTTKLCIQMALQMIGSAIDPSRSESPSRAIAVGEKSIVDHGMSHAIVVNVLTMGFFDRLYRQE